MRFPSSRVSAVLDMAPGGLQDLTRPEKRSLSENMFDVNLGLLSQNYLFSNTM